MNPEIRAIADRFMYEQATLKHMLALAPEGALDRPVPGSEWTVRQAFAHLAQSLESYRAIVERWLRGEPPLEGWDPERIDDETAETHAASSAADLKGVFGTGLNGLVAALAAIPEGRTEEQLGPRPVVETLKVLGNHAVSHAIPLVDALPEVRMDPLVLNWLLHAEFQDDSSREWQRELLADAREYIANHPEEEDEE